MRITIISDINSPHIIRWAKILRDRKHQISVISSAPNNYKIKNVDVYTCESRRFKNNLKKYCHEFVRTLKIRNFIKNIDPDIVHIHSFDYIHPLMISLVNRILNGFQNLIISTWGTDVVGLSGTGRSRRGDLSKKILLKQANAITATSKYLAEETRKIAPAGTKIHVIPFGINCMKFIKNCDHKLNKNRKIRIGFIKHLKPRYGPENLLYAMCKVTELYPDTEVIIVGKGELENYLKNLALHLGLEKKIQFLGHLSNEEIPKVLQNIDIFVMPSINESFGVAAIEAQAMEIPVVASNIGGIPEAVLDQKSGILINPNSTKELQESIIKLIENPKLRKKMGKAGREHVLSKYDIKKNAIEFENLYLRLANRKKN